MIAAPITGRQETPPGECFLCAMDSEPCAVKMLEGTIVSVREFNSQGEIFPYITLAVGGELATLRLPPPYRSLVRSLNDLGADLRRRKLTLRVFHLPAALATSEHKGQLLHRYQACEYTLAILEPDTLLNITDLNHADYCARQYLLNRLASSPQSAAAMRGNLVHSSFKELLKEHDRGELMQGGAERGKETPLATLQRHFEQALERSSIDLAITNTPVEEVRADAAPHLQSLANWFEQQHASLWDMPTQPASDTEGENMVRAETFLLAPEIGLRGRLDALWRQRSRQRLLELKTGGASGDLPRSAHRWQVQGYFSLLAVRRDPRMKNALATLLYSGTPGAATDFNLRFTITQFQRVNETRNILAFSHVTGIAPAPPGPSRCSKCAMLEQCQAVSSLLDWLPPQPLQPLQPLQPDKADENGQSAQAQPASHAANLYSETDRAFFKQYYDLLHLEEREIEAQQARLWQTPVNERVEQGSAIRNLQLIEKAVPTGQGEWLQTFACENTSELREGDEILLSDGDPVTGEVVTGAILSISSEQVTTWTPELIAHPRLIDRYATSIVHVRTLQNLLRWLQADSHLRELVAGAQRPRFHAVAYTPQPHLNEQQNLAVERALQMRDYLLIHGPPGTGKTSVIAHIVRQLCQQGQRVLLAAFTNQAVDNMLKRLESEGFTNVVRLGHDRSVDSAIQHRLLKRLVEQKGDQQSARDVLQNAPVVASTTATWSSDKYTPPAFTDNTGVAQENGSLLFDVAIIDEAGQLTLPAILGALRFARRFILVGDEKQLPPLVLSKEAGQAGLSDSLFSILKQADARYTMEQKEATSACVPLQMQYRMNRWISQFASHTFYRGELHPHPTVANRILTFSAPRSGVDSEKPWITRALDARLPLVFLDARSEPGIQEGLKTSNCEARVVREVVAGLLARGIDEGDIGIIAPYRAQVANLRRHLFASDEESGWRALSPTTRLSVDTVDRFQGGERSIIIISCATSVTPPADSQLRDHLTNPHRLNVALTRAQRKLLLIGNAAALAELPVFQQLLAYCRDERALIAH